MNTEVSTETINTILYGKLMKAATEDGEGNVPVLHSGEETFVQVEEDVTGEGETPAPTVH